MQALNKRQCFCWESAALPCPTPPPRASSSSPKATTWDAATYHLHFSNIILLHINMVRRRGRGMPSQTATSPFGWKTIYLSINCGMRLPCGQAKYPRRTQMKCLAIFFFFLQINYVKLQLMHIFIIQINEKFFKVSLGPQQEATKTKRNGSKKKKKAKKEARIRQKGSKSKLSTIPRA